MEVKIYESTDSRLIARLNKDVQKLHHAIEPKVFKAYNEKAISDYFEEIFKSKKGMAFVIEADGKAAGYIFLTLRYSEENPFKYATEVLYIDQICVDKGFKGLGLGKALVSFSKEKAKAYGVSKLEMNYWTKNSNSGEFFRSQGFKKYNERLVYIVD